jgi:hypothetical protein
MSLALCLSASAVAIEERLAHIGATHDSACAVDRYCEGCADLSYAGIGQSTQTVDKDGDRHAFDGVKIDRRALRDRIIGGLQHDLTGQAANGRRAGCDQRPSKPRDGRISGQHDDGPTTSVGKLAPPHLAAGRQRSHVAAAARRNASRLPQSSGSSIGCSS